MSEIDLSKAPKGATHFNTSNRRTWNWMKLSGGKWFFAYDNKEWREQGHHFPEDDDVLVEVADLRELAIDEMVEVTGLDDRSIFGLLYDAGYRKTEVKP